MPLIKESGIKFTVDDLCRSAGISKKTFYVLFPSKGDFAKKIYEVAFDGFDEALKSPMGEAYWARLFSSYMDLLMLTDERTFNLYSLSSKVRGHAEKEMGKRKALFSDALAGGPFPKADGHPSFAFMVESVLHEASRMERREAIIRDFASYLTEE
jgi:AcrR family transcriptional regulator